MAKKKFDGVVEAVHYDPQGNVDWVRAYLRRGMVFTDRVVLNRQTLIEHLKSGKNYLAGKRVPFMAATFEVSQPLRLLQERDKEILVTGEAKADRDHLKDIPVV